MAFTLAPPLSAQQIIPAALGPPLPPLPSIAAMQPRGAPETRAGALFLLAAVRDGLMAFFVVAEGPFFLPWLLIPIPYHWVLALFPLTGAIAASLASRFALRGVHREWIASLGLAAFVFSAFPGLLVLGPFGIAFTSTALFAHRKFLRRELQVPWAYPA